MTISRFVFFFYFFTCSLTYASSEFSFGDDITSKTCIESECEEFCDVNKMDESEPVACLKFGNYLKINQMQQNLMSGVYYSGCYNIHDSDEEDISAIIANCETLAEILIIDSYERPADSTSKSAIEALEKAYSYRSKNKRKFKKYYKNFLYAVKKQWFCNDDIRDYIVETFIKAYNTIYLPKNTSKQSIYDDAWNEIKWKLRYLKNNYEDKCSEGVNMYCERVSKFSTEPWYYANKWLACHGKRPLNGDGNIPSYEPYYRGCKFGFRK